jgi:hypothetical protein
MNGNVIMQTKLLNGKAEISLQDMQPGIYLLKLINEKGVSVKKIVKQ